MDEVFAALAVLYTYSSTVYSQVHFCLKSLVASIPPYVGYEIHCFFFTVFFFFQHRKAVKLHL